jgi:hypothetical protein
MILNLVLQISTLPSPSLPPLAILLKCLNSFILVVRVVGSVTLSDSSMWCTCTTTCHGGTKLRSARKNMRSCLTNIKVIMMIKEGWTYGWNQEIILCSIYPLIFFLNPTNLGRFTRLFEHIYIYDTTCCMDENNIRQQCNAEYKTYISFWTGISSFLRNPLDLLQPFIMVPKSHRVSHFLRICCDFRTTNVHHTTTTTTTTKVQTRST